MLIINLVSYNTYLSSIKDGNSGQQSLEAVSKETRRVQLKIKGRSQRLLLEAGGGRPLLHGYHGIRPRSLRIDQSGKDHSRPLSHPKPVNRHQRKHLLAARRNSLQRGSDWPSASLPNRNSQLDRELGEWWAIAERREDAHLGLSWLL